MYFVEFLKVSGRLDTLIADCPLTFSSPNAREVRDVIGTWILSILAGHTSAAGRKGPPRVPGGGLRSVGRGGFAFRLGPR